MPHKGNNVSGAGQLSGVVATRSHVRPGVVYGLPAFTTFIRRLKPRNKESDDFIQDCGRVCDHSAKERIERRKGDTTCRQNTTTTTRYANF